MDLRVRKLGARYHLPDSRRDERRRLDRALRRLRDEGLEAALERAGVGEHEEVCIRAVNLAVRLRLDAAEDSLASSWALALSEAIGRVLAAGGPGVVRYGSRRHALIDFAQGAAYDDLRRGWAWRQLGWGELGEATPPRAAIEAFIRALASEPESIVPVLRALAERGDLPRLVDRIESRRWPALAALALRAAGVDESILTAAELEHRPTPTSPLRRNIERAISASILARAVARLPISQRGPGEFRRAFAALVLLEVEPGLSTFEPAAVAERIGLAAAWLFAPTTGGPGPVESPPEAAAAPPRPPAGRERPTPRKTDIDGPDLDPSPPGPKVTEAGDPDAPAAMAEDSDDRPLVDVREEGATRFGGLLFLVAVVELLGIHRAAGAMAERSGRPFRWVLHALGCHALALAADDSAALAFAGLGPLAVPPSVDEPPATEPETEQLDSWIAAIAAHLRERLGWRDLPPTLVVDRVARREARVMADPGWIEVRISRRAVSTEIRRAGLDLNPGYIPWLGVVLTFLYE